MFKFNFRATCERILPVVSFWSNVSRNTPRYPAARFFGRLYEANLRKSTKTALYFDILGAGKSNYTQMSDCVMDFDSHIRYFSFKVRCRQHNLITIFSEIIVKT